MTRALSIALLVALFGLLAAGCGDEDELSDTSDPISSTDRYCAASDAFDEVEGLEGNEELVDELQSSAPDAIADDVEIILSAVRAEAGEDVEAASAVDQSDAEEAIMDFENENCEPAEDEPAEDEPAASPSGY